MKDLFGKALLDYYQGNYSVDIITSTNISEEDTLPLPYLFRDYSEMPTLEQNALNLCKGYILDVGCGAGNHSLWLQTNGFKVKAIDSSKGAIEVAKKRGVINAEIKSLINETGTFDTVLLLMNGTGIFQSLNSTLGYLKHLKSLLNKEGQILIDSSDIKYMYEDDDGGYWLDINANYYGELDYHISYKGEKDIPMKWLYLDFDTLNELCKRAGLRCEKVTVGKHYDYLAKLTRRVN